MDKHGDALRSDSSCLCSSRDSRPRPTGMPRYGCTTRLCDLIQAQNHREYGDLPQQGPPTFGVFLSTVSRVAPKKLASTPSSNFLSPFVDILESPSLPPFDRQHELFAKIVLLIPRWSVGTPLIEILRCLPDSTWSS